MARLARPALACAAAAAALRVVVALQGLAHNPLLSRRQLDSEYYVTWAREIAGGDWPGRGGVVGGAPFILNPLYAYVIAPLVAAARDPATTIAVFQALLAAATAALAVVAAGRFFGRAAAWAAGIAVAFSAPLVQLDAHVAVSGLAAFLVAGAVFASAPAGDAGRGRGHGPLAAGLWLGVGALARPVSPIALPFFAWRQWKEGGLRRAAVVVGVFAACALASLARNWSVAGAAVPYTTAAGLNIHLGNNSEARWLRGMNTNRVQFSPVAMHADARRVVAAATGRDPTPSETSSWFTKLAIDDFARAPAASTAFLAQKARWFFSPVEVPSTSSLAMDLRFSPALHAAFVPTWLVAALAAVGAFVHRRRRDVVCGAVAMALAHVVVLTLVFPLSHYRSPAVPALAVLAGGAVEAGVAAWRAGERRRVGLLAGGAFAVAAVGACPPQPNPLTSGDLYILGLGARDEGRWDDAESWLRESAAASHESTRDGRESPLPWFAMAEISAFRDRLQEADERLTKTLSLAPDHVEALLLRAKVARRLGDPARAAEDERRAAELMKSAGR
jgi:hypothetical protein